MFDNTRSLLAVALLLPSIPGCVEADDTSRLVVTIGGIDEWTDADILVTGPPGFRERIHRSGALDALAPGDYLITAPAVLSSEHAVVSTVFDLIGSEAQPVAVPAGADVDVDVDFERRAGTGALWVSTAAVDGSVLHGGATPEPHIELDVAAEDGVFDADGGLWTIRNTSVIDGVIEYYPSASVHTTGAPTPSATVEYGRGGRAAFDADGWLWVTTPGFRTPLAGLLGVDAPSIAGGENNPAEVRISSDGDRADPHASLQRARGTAFDREGNLWVACLNSIERFSPAQLAQGGAQTPSIRLVATNDEWSEAESLAFDDAGNLWVAVSEPPSLLMFSPDQQRLEGEVRPARTMGANGDSLSADARLAFDESGTLWVLGRSGSLVGYTSEQLTIGASVVPAMVLPWAHPREGVFAFNPPTSGVPIRTPRIDSAP